MITAPVSALVLDLDGVLSPPQFVLSPQGEAFKIFSVRDGLGLEEIKKRGVLVLILTSRSDPSNLRRAKELGLELRISSGTPKAETLQEWIAEKSLLPSQVVYLGDDLVDLSAFRLVGWPIAVGDAPTAVKKSARRVTRAAGGFGAVREVCEWILLRKP
jgi:3-deoxy-D-manno-octulosonate 8-phosphate phosphatase (KDO 8-P phosphatase)